MHAKMLASFHQSCVQCLQCISLTRAVHQILLAKIMMLKVGPRMLGGVFILNRM